MALTRESEALGALMRSRRLNDPALADLVGTSKQQINKLRNGERRLTKQWAERLAPHLGVEWYELLGWQPDAVSDASRAATTIEADGYSTAGAPHGVPPADGAKASFTIPEYDVRAMAGPGAEPPEIDGTGTHPIVATWQVPADYLRAFVANPDAVRFIRVVGDSMEPEYPSGERVAVDISHTVPSPPGVYVVWDGLALVLKRIEVIVGTNPLMVRLSSSNPAYPPYERPAADVHINGRVLGRWTWK